MSENWGYVNYSVGWNIAIRIICCKALPTNDNYITLPFRLYRIDNESWEIIDLEPTILDPITIKL